MVARLQLKSLENASCSRPIMESADTHDFTTLIANPATDGIVTLSLSNTQTDALKTGRYVYDVEISFVDSDSNTVVERILEGRVQVTPSVTK